MPNKLVLLEASQIDRADKLEELFKLVERAEKNIENALSPNTRKVYKSQWNIFEAWCSHMEIPSFPTSDKILLIYLTHRAEKGSPPGTLTQIYSAIREYHRMKDAEPPRLDGKLYRSWTGARKKASQDHTIKKARALSPEHLKLAVSAISGDLATRDRALLLIGWCAALRSEEITSLDIGDIIRAKEGLRIQIRKSKTDQMGVGHEIGVMKADGDVCPVTAWLDYADGDLDGITEGPAFASRTGRRLSTIDVGRILRRALKRAGIPSQGYSAHSLRAGCITAAAQAGHPLESIQRQSRHKSLEVLLGYIRTATLFQGNATKGLL